MFKFLEKSVAAVSVAGSFLKKKAFLVAAGAAALMTSSAQAAGGTDMTVTDFVTTTEAGVVAVDPGALVTPVRSLVVASITQALGIFLIFLALGVIIMLVRRFVRGR